MLGKVRKIKTEKNSVVAFDDSDKTVSSDTNKTGMESGVFIKSEPMEDGYETVDNLHQDRLTGHSKDYVQNGFPEQEARNESGIQRTFTPRNRVEDQSSVGNANFSCILCDLICDSRDELRRHLKTEHKSNNNLFSQGPAHRTDFYSSYLQFRYTCNACGAKFKTFKNYFSHSMSHKDYGNLQSSLNDAMLRSEKEVLQNYFDAEEGVPGFRCEECKTVFMQRDSYAMHMMMRAMNETCRPNIPDDVSLQTKMEPMSQEEQPPGNQDVVTNVTDTHSDETEAVSTESQKCLEDVTCKVDQDEYLKSVLDRVVVQNGAHDIRTDLKYSENGRSCIFCAQSFADQDSLAMHVMSIHADQMFVINPNRSHMAPKPRDSIKWMSPYLCPLDCKYCGKKFVSRDNLAMHVLTHTQERTSDTAHDGNAHPVKRKADQIEISHDPPFSTGVKMIRRFGNPISFAHDKQILSAADLYCTLCSIQFYSKGDFEWHLRCRHSSLESKNEPLCLTKQDKVNMSDKSNADSPNTEIPKDKPTRRNSFSIDEKSRHHYVTPKRPISADTLAKTTTHLYSDCSSQPGPAKPTETNDSKSKNLKIKKEIQRSMAIACVDALSSNEKRIIYSVFGNELMKTKAVNDVKQPTESVDKIGNTDKLDNARKSVKTIAQQNVAHNLKAVGHDTQIPKTSPDSAVDLNEDFTEVLKGKDTAMCRYCEIIFLNKAIYYLHMGLHNVNNQWQCNVCGKICKNAVDFAAHIIHM